MTLQTNRLGVQRVYVDSSNTSQGLDGTWPAITGTAGQLAADASYNVWISGVADMVVAGRNIKANIDTNIADILTNTQAIAALDVRVGQNEQDIDVIQADIVDHMHWRGTWTQGQYQPYYVVRDGNYTMIANKVTTERAAPTPIGASEWRFPESPSWTQQSYSGNIFSGIRIYDLTESFQINALRVWLSDVSGDTQYRVIEVDNVTGYTAVGSLFSGSVLGAPGWYEVTLPGNTYLLPGDDVEIHLVAQNQAGAPTNETALTSLLPTSATAATPVSNGDVARNTAHTILNVFPNDRAGAAITWLSQIRAGDELDLWEESAVNRRVNYIVSRVTDQGTYTEFEVFKVSEGSQGDPRDGNDTVLSGTYRASLPTLWEELPGYWLTDPPAHASVQGLLTTGEVDEKITDDAYGIDLNSQFLDVSDDWDLVAFGGRGSTGGGGVPPGGGSDFDLIVFDQVVTPSTPQEAFDPLGGAQDQVYGIGPWNEDGDEVDQTLTDRRDAIQAQIDARASKGGRIVFPPLLYQINSDLVTKDGVRVDGAGMNKTYVRMKNHAGTVELPSYVFRPFQMKECEDQPTQPKWANNASQQTYRPQWFAEIRDLSVHGGYPVTDRPSNLPGAPGFGNKTEDITLHGIGLYEGAQRVQGCKVTHCNGSGLVVAGGWDNRQGTRLPTDGQECIVDNLFIDKCFTGIHHRFGSSDHVFRHITISACRDYGIIAEAAATTYENVHIYGTDVGVILQTGNGVCHFTGKLEIETCFKAALVNIGMPGTIINQLRAFQNEFIDNYSSATFVTGVHLEKSTIINELAMSHAEPDAYAIQNFNGSGTEMRAGYLVLEDDDAWGISHHGSWCHYDIRLTGPPPGAPVSRAGFVLHQGSRNHIALRNDRTNMETLWVKAGQLYNKYRVFGGIVRIADSQATFENNGNMIESFGATVLFDQTGISAPVPSAWS